MNWTDCYSANFRELADDEAMRWGQEIGSQVANLKEGEVLKAVQSLAASWGSDYPPKLRELVTQIRRNRMDARNEAESGADAACRYCGGSGWMLAPVTVVNCRVRCVGHVEMPGCEYTEQRIPCQCSAGKTVATDIILKKLQGNFDAMQASRERLQSDARTAAQFIDALHWLERLRYTSSAYRLPAQEREEMDQYVAELKDRLPSEKSIARAMTSKPRYPYPASTGPVIYN